MIAKALNAFEGQMVMRRRASERDLKYYDWELPSTRIYNEKTHVVDQGVRLHALLPYFRLENSFVPELDFSAFLEKHGDYVEWWYKNGDNGIANFAIPYVNIKGEQALFYVDFIIRMKNGRLFLFDTKTKGSDENAVCKHNALIDYVADMEHVEGGILIKEGGNWKYSTQKIDSASNLHDWKCFFPDECR